jgi:hypothetical protein
LLLVEVVAVRLIVAVAVLVVYLQALTLCQMNKLY